MKIHNYMKPSTIEEAYELVCSGGTIIGGGAWLKLMPKTIENAVDISALGLNGITESEDAIHIGAMATLRSIETNVAIQAYMDGVIAKGASHIMGVTVRNIATIGGTVSNRFGFSDLITPLLAVGAELNFHHHGHLTLEAFLDKPFRDKDILLEVILKKKNGHAAFKTLKKTSTDFPVINVSVVKEGADFRVCVGARPGVAKLSHKAMALLNEASVIDDQVIEGAALAVEKDLSFGTNSRASKAYRAQVAKVLVERCVKEVMS